MRVPTDENKDTLKMYEELWRIKGRLNRGEGSIIKKHINLLPHLKSVQKL